jgi:Xaa-Pro dipeptidase
MRQDVIAREIRAMREAGLDALISISPENFAYVTGFLSPTQPLMRWRHAMALVTANAATALVVVDMEANTIRAKAPAGTEIEVWREFKFDAMQVLADLLRKHGLGKARIGIELD